MPLGTPNLKPETLNCLRGRKHNERKEGFFGFCVLEGRKTPHSVSAFWSVGACWGLGAALDGCNRTLARVFDVSGGDFIRDSFQRMHFGFGPSSQFFCSPVRASLRCMGRPQGVGVRQ